MQLAFRKCHVCKDVSEKAFLLPCLHTICDGCLEKVATSARQRGSKLACQECAEDFDVQKLETLPNTKTAYVCGECDQRATQHCGDCNEYLCKLHGDGHATSKRTRNHVLTNITEVALCKAHQKENAVGFCTTCQQLVCADCIVGDHRAPHFCVSNAEAKTMLSDTFKTNVQKLLESIPALDSEVNKCKGVQRQLETERAQLEAKIAELRQQEQIQARQIDQLDKRISNLRTVQDQVGALSSITSDLSYPTLHRLQSYMQQRVFNLSNGLTGSSTASIAPKESSIAAAPVYAASAANLQTSQTIQVTRPPLVTNLSSSSVFAAPAFGTVTPNLVDTSTTANYFALSPSAPITFHAPLVPSSVSFSQTAPLPSLSTFNHPLAEPSVPAPIPSSSVPIASTIAFGRISTNMQTDNGNSITKTSPNKDCGYGILEDGCSSGTRTWKVTLNAITNPTTLMLGVFNSNERPANNFSSNDVNNNGVGYGRGYRGGVKITLDSQPIFSTGDVILVTVDCSQECLVVHNTTKGWTQRILQLQPPNPAYYPHVNLNQQNDSVKIELV